MKVLVTGGSGYLGPHVVRALNASDFSRRSGKNVLDAEDVREIANYDIVVHLAARLDKALDAAEEVFLTNVEGTINVLKNVKKDAIFIFASTKDVYGRFADGRQNVAEDCPTLYAGQSALEWSKLIAERYVEFYGGQTGFRTCIFRCSTLYAPATEGSTPGFVGAFADDINKGTPIVLPDGDPVRDLMHVDDFSSACKAFAESVVRHGLYNLGGGQENAVSMRKLIELMEQVSGLQAVIDEGQSAPAPVPLRYVSDLDLVMHELDWKPMVGLEKGLSTLF